LRLKTHDGNNWRIKVTRREKVMKKVFVSILALFLGVLTVFGTGCTKKQTELIMATNAEFPPYEYHDGSDDKIVGIDAEIAEAIAEKLGCELEIEDIAFDSVIPEVTSGKADIGMAGMTVTEERKKSVNFSDSYAKGVQVVIVKEDSAIQSVDDINENTKIGAQVATTGSIYAQDDYGAEAVQEFSKGADAVQALISGKVDCVIIDNEPAKAYVAANEGLKILDTAYAEEDYAISMNKSNTELQKKVNDALKELIADGSVQKIIDKYNITLRKRKLTNELKSLLGESLQNK
jgi:polar amino acid transport system substrate-binding protein